MAASFNGWILPGWIGGKVMGLLLAFTLKGESLRIRFILAEFAGKATPLAFTTNTGIVRNEYALPSEREMTAMSERVLFVDDEQRVLDALRVNLRKKLTADFALGAQEALKKLEKEPSYAVIVSDQKMPGMSGMEFLAKAQDMAPDSVRIMLTGHGDFELAMEGVNKGRLFRFLQKPTSLKQLTEAVKAAIKQHRLIVAEKQLLKNTLKGTVELLTEIVSLINPEAFGRSQRINRCMKYLMEQKELTGSWQYELAGMLSQLGCILLPPETLEKLQSGQDLIGEELQMFDMHPMLGADLLRRIPRLDEVAEIVMYQEKNFDGSGAPADGVKEDGIPLGARMLKLALDYDTAVLQSKNTSEAFAKMERNIERYDPELLYYLEGYLGKEARYELTEMTLKELRPGVIFDQSILNEKGAVIVRKSTEATVSLIERLKMFDHHTPLPQPFKVLIPQNYDD